MTIACLVIARYERAVAWKSQSFAGILEPGVRWIFASFGTVAAQLYDLRVPEFEHPRVDFLLQDARDTMEKHFDIVEIGEQEVGVVYKNGRLDGVLAPGKRQLYWKGPIDVRVSRVDISKDLELPQAVAELLARAGIERRAPFVSRAP